MPLQFFLTYLGVERPLVITENHIYFLEHQSMDVLEIQAVITILALAHRPSNNFPITYFILN